MIQRAKTEEEVEQLILHDSTFSPKDIAYSYKNREFIVDNVKRWQWEKHYVVDGEIRMPQCKSKITVKNVERFKTEIENSTSLPEKLEIIWIECQKNRDMRIYQKDGEEIKDLRDIIIDCIFVQYILTVSGVDVEVEDLNSPFNGGSF